MKLRTDVSTPHNVMACVNQLASDEHRIDDSCGASAILGLSDLKKILEPLRNPASLPAKQSRRRKLNGQRFRRTVDSCGYSLSRTHS